MAVPTNNGQTIEKELLQNYFKSLVNSFFKILPMRENGERSLPTYIVSLQTELTGCQSFVPELEKEAQLMSLLSILQYLHDNPDCPVRSVRREVFKAISICNKLEVQYTGEEVEK